MLIAGLAGLGGAVLGNVVAWLLLEWRRNTRLKVVEADLEALYKMASWATEDRANLRQRIQSLEAPPVAQQFDPRI